MFVKWQCSVLFPTPEDTGLQRPSHFVRMLSLYVKITIKSTGKDAPRTPYRGLVYKLLAPPKIKFTSRHCVCE